MSAWHTINVENAADWDLVSARTQLNIDLQCGPGATFRKEIEVKIRDINRELARRERAVDAAKERIAAAAQVPSQRACCACRCTCGCHSGNTRG